jgi:predicted ATPase
MLKQLEASDFVNMTKIALHGFELESLNEMVSEALCLPRRKTRSLAEVVHQKTLGVPLFVVEFLDALLTENLLVHNTATGWGWDVDSIDLKKISSGVAELLACKLEQLPDEVLSAVKILSVLGTHVDRGVLEVVKSYDASDGSKLIPSLYTAQREGLLDIAGPTFTFMHDTIKRAAFDLIPEADRIPLMLRIVACLLPYCTQDEQSDSYLLTTVDIINRIGSQAVSKNLGQSRVFAQLNLEAGKKSANFTTSSDYFEAGITFLQGDYWNDQYELALSLFESAAAANYSTGRHDQVAIHTNKVFAMAKNFEDKFKSHCLYINVLAIGNTEKAMEQIYYLLKSLGEDINPNAINAPMAIVDFSSLKQMLGGARKDVLLQLPPMTDRKKLMSMKLMAMLALYYNQQMTHLSGYISCKMIRMSIQHGHCEDTVFALSVFAGTTMNYLSDTNEASSLAKCAISMSRLYKSEQLIPRIYSRIYGAVLCFTQPMATALPPLLKACRIAFARGNSEQSIFNTTIYVTRSLQSGKKIPVLLDEVKAFALQHVSDGFSVVFRFLHCHSQLTSNYCHLAIRRRINLITWAYCSSF